MELEFKTDKLKLRCEKWTFFKKKDVHMNTKLVHKIRELEQAMSLLDIKLNKSLHLHKLKDNRKYELAIDIDWRKNVFRIIFETIPKDIVYDDFWNDWKFKEITKIKILEVADYH